MSLWLRQIGISDARYNLPRAPPAPEVPAEVTPGRPPIEDPDSAPATFGGKPSDSGDGTGPSGGINEPILGRPESPGGTEGEPAAPIPQALGVPNPPSDLENEFSSLLNFLGPDGEKPLPKDKSVMYSGDMLPEASAWVAGRESDGFLLMESAMDGWKSPSSPKKEDINTQLDIQSGAFAAASSGEVKVFLPENGLTSQTVFTRIEWPQMVAEGSKVTRITWVDEVTGTDVGPIWTEDQGPVPFELNKPIANMVPDK